MSKDPMQDAADKLSKAVKNVEDTVDEDRHRTVAELEHASRGMMGNEMKPSEKISSAVNEAKHRAEAGIDAGKREVRNKT